MYKYKRNGFTLVELMAVIIIISLIALLTFPNIINQIKKTKKSNNKMIEDVVIEQAKKYVNDNKEELLEDEYCIQIATLIDNDYIKEDLTSINGIKDNKAVQVISGDNYSYKIVNKDKCVPTAVKYLLKKTNPKTITNYIDGDIHEMYTFDHEATEQTPALRDYRYIGSDPNNYVEFNNELWRIIGVFKVEDGNGKWEERVKLIRNESLGSIKWSADSVNEWIGSTMQKYLNETFVLGDDAKEMIDSSKYYLGGYSAYQNGEIFYKYERGKTTYNGRSKSWIGKVALMYPSDYIYTYAYGIDTTCYNTPRGCSSNYPQSSWLFESNYTQWFLMPLSSNDFGAFNVKSNGDFNANSSYYPFDASPVLHLKPNVKITSGDGTIENAYKLSL